MKRSTALLRLVGVALLLSVSFGLVPGLASAAPATDPCPNCLHAGLCQPCEDGGERLCLTRVCCGVTTIISCGTCSLNHCVLPPG